MFTLWLFMQYSTHYCSCFGWMSQLVLWCKAILYFITTNYKCCIVWLLNFLIFWLDNVQFQYNYADLPGLWVSDSPQTTICIPPSLLIASYYPILFVCNQKSNSVALLKLTYVHIPMDSTHHLESARDCKQGERKYQQIFVRIWLPGDSLFLQYCNIWTKFSIGHCISTIIVIISKLC